MSSSESGNRARDLSSSGEYGTARSASMSTDRSRSESRGRPRDQKLPPSGVRTKSRSVPTVDYYEVLGLSRTASVDEIKIARRKALLKCECRLYCRFATEP